MSSGLGSSSVDPSLLEQHQSPDGSFLVSRGHRFGGVPPFLVLALLVGIFALALAKLAWSVPLLMGGVPVGAVDDPESDFLKFGGVDPETDSSMGKESCASGVRSVIGSTAGESQRIIGMRDVFLSDTSLHLPCVINSSGFGDKFACASVGSALLASASAPRFRSSLACLSDAVVAHARIAPDDHGSNSLNSEPPIS